MYYWYLSFHSLIRWFVLVLPILAIAYCGWAYLQNKAFDRIANVLRSASSGFAKLQLLIGFLLYAESTLIRVFLQNPAAQISNLAVSFFSVLHFLGMTAAVVFITVGSSKAKKLDTAAEKHRAIWLWFGCAVILIIIFIPWPFSPLAQRPLIRF